MMVTARIIKLAKEEEKSIKRMKEAERKAEFVAEMNRTKNERMEMR